MVNGREYELQEAHADLTVVLPSLLQKGIICGICLQILSLCILSVSLHPCCCHPPPPHPLFHKLSILGGGGDRQCRCKEDLRKNAADYSLLEQFRTTKN
jgi:hypothetical protein